MTKSEFILVKEVQSIGVAFGILQSKKWYSFPLKIPAVVTVISGVIVGNLTTAIYAIVSTAREGQRLSRAEFKERMSELAFTEKYINLVEKFID